MVLPPADVEDILFPKRVICTRAACVLAAVAARAMVPGSHLAPERSIVVGFVFMFFISVGSRQRVAGKLVLPQAGA